MALRTWVMAFIGGLLTAWASSPAQAQVNGTWTFELGEVRLEVDNRSNIAGQTPPWIATTTTLMPGDSRTVFSGGYRNLVWEGYWTFYGSTPPQMGAVYRPCAQPHNLPHRNATNRYGRFRIQFNAAENRFEGRMANCNMPLDAPRVSAPLTGTRNNTFTVSGQAAPAPRAPRDLPSARPNLTPPPPPDLAEQAQRSEHLQNYTSERDCRSLRSLLGGRWSTGFETRPCMVSFGDQVEITTRTDQTQRPVAVIYRAFHPGWPDRIPEAYILRGVSGRVGLPNQGVPRRGHSYRFRPNVDICRETLWLLSLQMSDGTESDPIGILLTGTEPIPLLRRPCRPDWHDHQPGDYTRPYPERSAVPLQPRG